MHDPSCRAFRREVARAARIARLLGLAGLFGLVELQAGCSAITNSSLGGGIGAQCTTDADCQASSCNLPPGGALGVCAKTCANDLDCPRPSRCIANSSEGRALCQLPLDVQALFFLLVVPHFLWSLARP